jgi:hypothetical protein
MEENKHCKLPVDGQWNCPKHVEVHFLAKINLGNQCVCWFCYKEIYYDPRSHERKIYRGLFNNRIVIPSVNAG